MATKKSKTGSKAMSAAQRARKAMSREAQASYAEVQQGVKHLEKSIAEIQQGLRRAEKKIEGDALATMRAPSCGSADARTGGACHLQAH